MSQNTSNAHASIDFLSSIPSEVLRASGRYGRVYDLQLQHQRATNHLDWQREQVAEEIDRAQRAAVSRGGFGPLNQDPETHPQVIAAREREEALRAQVTEARAEVGGIVYLPAADNVEKIQRRLASLNRKAAKLGTDPIALTVTDEQLVLNYKPSDDYGWGCDFRHVFAVLSGTTPQIPGYEFLATITPTEHGNVIKRIPPIRYGAIHNLDDRGGEFGDQFNHPESPAATALDAIDLTRFRSTGTVCEHCHTTRSRKDLYVVYNETTGEAIQVGRTCLRDYMGNNNPEAVLRVLEQVFEIIRSIGTRSETEVIPTETFLVHCAAVMRAEGGYQRGLGRYGANNIWLRANKKTDRDNRPLWVEPTETDELRAREILTWVRGEWEETGEFAENVKLSLASDWMDEKLYGYAGAAFIAYQKWAEKAEERARRAAEEAEASPVIQGRIEITGAVLSTKWQYSQYGETKKMLVRDDRGFKVFGTVPAAIEQVEKGDRVTLTATVEASGDDETFGFYSRPSKAQIIEEAHA